MKKAFMWVSGLCFIDKNNYQWLEIFSDFFLLKIIPFGGPGKTKNIPDMNWLISWNTPKIQNVDCLATQISVSLFWFRMLKWVMAHNWV